eukprot:7583575-Ditylum_brightwellii.AAC.1
MGQAFLCGETSASELTSNTHVQSFLDEIQRREGDPPEIDTIITITNINSMYKNWEEKTSTSPSSHYLGLCKALLQ